MGKAVQGGSSVPGPGLLGSSLPLDIRGGSWGKLFMEVALFLGSYLSLDIRGGWWENIFIDVALFLALVSWALDYPWISEVGHGESCSWM